MQDAPHADLPRPASRSATVSSPGEPMPLAAARNRAAAAASGELLVFLDVDCIPSPTLVARYAATAVAPGGFLGEVLYLPAGALDAGRTGRSTGRRAPSGRRRSLRTNAAGARAGELWGLSFALSADAGARSAAWTRLCRLWRGGDRPRRAARGPPAADLLGRRCARLPPASSVHVPPLQHFDAILGNARCFAAARALVHGLLARPVPERGLIAWDADTITVLREPTAEEMAASRMPLEVLFS